MDSATEINNLIYRYGELVDLGLFDEIGQHLKHAVMTADGTDMRLEGPEAIAGNYHNSTRLYPETGTPRTKHVITNPILEIDEEAGRAEGRAYYTVFQQTEELPLQPIISGRYHHRYTRIDGAWQVTGFHFFVDLVGDLSKHLLYDLASIQSES